MGVFNSHSRSFALFDSIYMWMFVVLSLFANVNAQVPANPAERAVLQTLVSSGWLTSALCGTTEVGCNGVPSVISLTIQNKPARSIIPEISFLSNLTHLLISNSAVGFIPLELGNLYSLQRLEITKNSVLSGNIPSSLCSLPSLYYLSLMNNNLIGTIPQCWSTITTLDTVDFSGNPLTGHLPDSYPPWLRNFAASNSGLTGSIPSELGQLPLLSTLSLSNSGYLNRNTFFGTIPSTLFHQNITYLNVANNLLDGTLPIGIMNMTDLAGLVLDGNNFSGSIPVEWASLPNLATLVLSWTNLNGSLPDLPVGSFPSLSNLYLTSTPITGTIPESWSQLTNMTRLDITGTKISGPLDPLRTWSRLQMIGISDSLVTGPFPQNFSTFTSLTEVYANRVQMNSSIAGLNLPSSVNNLQMDSAFVNGSLSDLPYYVTQLSMKLNQLTDMPADCSAFPYIVSLLIASNPFPSGPIPNFTACPLLQLDLSYTNRSGTLPPLPRELKSLNLNQNKLNGDLTEIANLTDLQYLHIQNNQFTGDLTPTANLITLIHAEFDRNALMGTIPIEYANMPSFNYMSISFNSISAVPNATMPFFAMPNCDISNNPIPCPLPNAWGDLCKADCVQNCPPFASGYPNCTCNVGYRGPLTTTNNLWQQNCTAVSCPADAAGPFPNCGSCASTLASGGGYTWSPTNATWVGECKVNCPLSSSYNSVNDKCECDIGYSGSSSLALNAMTGLWSGGCILVSCPSGATNPPNCECDVGYFNSTITWDAASADWLGNCTAWPCPPTASTQFQAPECQCDTGYTNTMSWDSMNLIWLGGCVANPSCPPNSTLSPVCTCNPGFVSTLVWDTNSQSWNGECTVAACPNQTGSLGAPPNCTCAVGYVNTLAWNTTSQIWDGGCSVASCPLNSSGLPCSCDPGYLGTLTWSPPVAPTFFGGWTGTCNATSCVIDTCSAGYTTGPAPNCPCIDVNECANAIFVSNATAAARVGTIACDTHAQCLNTVGSYYCACNSGYVGDGVSCLSSRDAATKSNTYVVVTIRLLNTSQPNNTLLWNTQFADEIAGSLGIDRGRIEVVSVTPALNNSVLVQFRIFQQTNITSTPKNNNTNSTGGGGDTRTLQDLVHDLDQQRQCNQTVKAALCNGTITANIDPSPAFFSYYYFTVKVIKETPLAVIIAILVALILICVLAYLLHKRFSPPEARAAVLLGALVSVSSLISNSLLAYTLSTIPDLSTYLYCVLAFMVGPYVINFGYTIRLLYGERSNSKLSEWMKSHPLTLSYVVFICGINTSNLTVLTSAFFGLSIFQAPLAPRITLLAEASGIIGFLFSDIPLTVIQVLLLALKGDIWREAGLALLFTSMRTLSALVRRLFSGWRYWCRKQQLDSYTHNSKPNIPPVTEKEKEVELISV